ncbi:unnamed protein product [Penicillium salamii]|uniref:Uncharacterized protein n=1 Tax=Penicillium salamii TaxID=1612424 RepID=A0A9W4NV12_9EURO|nr:unnamed protein product [Penicillium salamii]CAG8404379.1 unnamed protein product [Penicillium salamii]CAG8413320.1 unnamed protein product [Penicillium salamii]CAG8417765.1 unnamed protein product [Penicillium salamii]
MPNESPKLDYPSTDSHTKNQDGYFQCGFCKRHYNRADHLIRHVRSHTREKPYVCDVCDKGFARPDLLKRHAAGHANDRDRKRKRSSSIAKQSRVSQACKACASSKLKCDESKPCRRCRERHLACDWQDIQQQASPDPHQDTLLEMAATENRHLDSMHSPSDVLSPILTPLEDFSSVSALMTSGVNLQDSVLSPVETMSNQQLSRDTGVSPNDHESAVFSIDGTFFPNFIPDSLIPSLSRYSDSDFPGAVPDYAQYGALDNFHFDLTLTDGDFSLIDFYNSHSITPDVPDSRTDTLCGTESGIGLGAEAYHRSSLSAYKPAREDHAFDDHENLSVPQMMNTPETSVFTNEPTLCDRLSPTSRDLILSLILEVSREATLSRIVRSFPGADLLDALVQQYFEHQTQDISAFIHIPTFHTNTEDPGILAGLAAAGAVRSSNPTIRKLGYALNEGVRMHLPTKYERDNTFIRDLRTSQTYALTIDIGIWSGNRRKTEIAESFSQPLITMLRRALRFRRSIYPVVIPLAEDVGNTLESKWRSWVEQESFKRLVYYVFLHDAQTAMALNVNPIISYADMELPLPASRQLWDAKSAVEWKDIIHAKAPPLERLPSLADLLRDMSQLTMLQDVIDTQLAASVLVHGLSALVNEYHRLKFISSGGSKHWHALVTSSRQQELDQALQHFRMVCSELKTGCRPETILIGEVVSMLLYMSLEELQLFAGREDKQEARRVYHSALEWIASSDSRQAISHAGQIIRAARSMSSGALTGFLAIGVYYASLAFWSYSVVSRANTEKLPGQSESQNSGAGTTVFLDCDRGVEVSKFVTLNCGFPALHDSGRAVYLVNPAAIMRLAEATLHSDPPKKTPALVQMLSQLMRDLGNCVDRGR